MGKHVTDAVWCTHSIRAREFVLIETADRKHIKFTIKSEDDAGQVSTTVKRDTARRLVNELLDCLESTQ